MVRPSRFRESHGSGATRELRAAGGAAGVEEGFFFLLPFLLLFFLLPSPTPGLGEGWVWTALPNLKGKKIFEAEPDRIFSGAAASALEAEFPFAAVPNRSFESSRIPVFERDTVPNPVFEAPELATFCPWS